MRTTQKKGTSPKWDGLTVKIGFIFSQHMFLDQRGKKLLKGHQNFHVLVPVEQFSEKFLVLYNIYIYISHTHIYTYIHIKVF